jgi:hypothetical protein
LSHFERGIGGGGVTDPPLRVRDKRADWSVKEAAGAC